MKPIFLPIRSILITLSLVIIPCILMAQFPKQPVLDKGTIESQMNSLLNNSSQYEYNGVYYKGIKTGYLNTLKANVNDTIKNLYRKLNATVHTVNEKNILIDSLKNELINTNDLYLTTRKEKNSLKFLGITFSKTAYNSLLWTIIIGLLFLLIILVLLYKKNNAVTVQTKTDLEDLKKEFEIHRKRALEREEKLSRQHLDELNKYKR